jgi:hypothetical protein
MYRTYIFRRNYLPVALFLSLLISGLAIGATFMYTNTQATRSAVISKALLSQILTQAEPNVQVLVETHTNDYARVVADIEALGGEVTFQYKYATGLAAKLPANKVFQLAENLNIKAIFLDEKRSISACGRTMIDGEKMPQGCISPMFNIDEFDQPRDFLKESREGILGEYTLPKDAPVIHLTPEQIELLATDILEPHSDGSRKRLGHGRLRTRLVGSDNRYGRVRRPYNAWLVSKWSSNRRNRPK